HSVVAVINREEDWEKQFDSFLSSDAAIEFSTPGSAISNFYRCFDHQIPLISGTTGWYGQMEQVLEKCKNSSNTFIYGSNFSIGANIFFKMNEMLASLMNQQEQYEVTVEETHHITKKDAPSGTAITLAQSIISQLDRKKSWQLSESSTSEIVSIKANRIADISGIHKVVYSSEEDVIELKHTAHHRAGFAQGAVKAALWLIQHPGIYNFKDIALAL
ncbi:MAG: 4-hydroxy-tetrahydrodipicolinate reductase, partial [Bacteroidales bacterium]